MKHKIWAFYVKTGSIERRMRISTDGQSKVLLSTEEEIRATYPFDSWYGRGTVLKVIPKAQEKKSEICPNNAHHHHLLPSSCPFCGGPHGGVHSIHSQRNVK